ncbi:hypothetical protein QR680_006957 [Steinernema hermaphroditum]|uniref:C2H2-type domain-containing protein n=1 Tax=Steinernema hermaphroditum TaxID=289476 RepID=A0AA39HYK2_9BILA|nr:hypothetical protein QR680_006957 [Steinernema hermaphroditum]
MNTSIQIEPSYGGAIIENLVEEIQQLKEELRQRSESLRFLREEKITMAAKCRELEISLREIEEENVELQSENDELRKAIEGIRQEDLSMEEFSEPKEVDDDDDIICCNDEDNAENESPANYESTSPEPEPERENPAFHELKKEPTEGTVCPEEVPVQASPIESPPKLEPQEPCEEFVEAMIEAEMVRDKHGAEKSFWQCQLCKKIIQSSRNLPMHLAHHRVSQLPCPFSGCKKMSFYVNHLYGHLKSVHKITALKNKPELYNLYTEFRRKHSREVQSFIEVFFPVTSLVGFGSIPKNPKALNCKKCKASVRSCNFEKIKHILSHIKVRLECPKDECPIVLDNLEKLFDHIEYRHKTTVAGLSQSEKDRFLEGQMKLNEAVKSVYFHLSDPCHDFSEAICTTTKSVVSGLNAEFETRLSSVLSKYELDDVTKELLDSLTGFHLRDECRGEPNIPNGKERAAFLGMLAAHGMTSISVKINATLKTAELRLRSIYSTPPPRKQPPRMHGFETVTVPSKYLPKHLKDFLVGYFETVDFEKRFNVEEFDVTFEKDVAKSPEFTESSRVFKSSFGIQHVRPKRKVQETHPSLYALTNSAVMASYTNLLISSELLKIDPKLVHDRDFVKDLKIMTQNILDEIGFHFDEMDWISAESKEKLKNVHTIDDYLFGPSEKFLNQTMVDKALKFYQDYFRKMRPFADDNMEKLGMPSYCRPVYYERVFRIADTAFQLSSDYDFGHYGEHAILSYAFYENNAGNTLENKKMIFGLQYIDGYRQKLPLPFVYGAIGETIGHETFHSYGVKKIFTDGVDDLFNSYTYRSAVSCLEDYYSSFIGPNWTRPDGAMKANEGFADLQSARMIARLIKRGIYKEAHKDSSRWFSDTKDFDHFDEIIGRDDDDRDLKLAFSAMADLYSGKYIREQLNTELETEHMMEDVHPRYVIRSNAVHRQLPEFSEAFQCSFDSRMYTVEELCDAFPPKEKVKSASPSSGPPRNYGFETTTVLAKNLPEHLMDFLLAYFETVDFEKRFDVEEFDVTFEKDVEKSPDFTESSRVFKSSFGIEHIRPKRAAREADPPLLVLADSDVMSSYSNLLISSGLLKIDPKLVHDPDFVKDLKIMTQNILDEIGFHFDEMDWISPESKEKLKNVHTIDDYLFGPSEKFLNQTMVDKALKFYQDYFRKMRPFADENMEKLDFPPNCKPVYYETVFKVADTAFQLYNDYDFGHYGERTVISYQFYENNAGNSAENKKMIFGLPHISGYRQKLPLPFVYGAIGGTIGHETFHSYGVRKILIDGVDDVFNSYTYRSAVSCLEDYYSSFIGPNWTRPDGAMKANEGFADLQSARMIARLIKRGIYKEAHKDSSRWFSDTKDFDHFDEIIGRDDDDRDLKLAFSAMADVYCREYFQEQNNTKLETKNMMEDVHPRYAIRLNAIHRQLPEFTETFNTQKRADMNLLFPLLLLSGANCFAIPQGLRFPPWLSLDRTKELGRSSRPDPCNDISEAICSTAKSVVAGLTSEIFSILSKYEPDEVTWELVQSVVLPPPSGPTRSYGFEAATVPAKDLPEHLKDFLVGYFETVDFEKRFNLEEFNVTFEKDVAKSPEFTESSRVFKSSFGIQHVRPRRSVQGSTPLFSILANSDLLGSYTNLLISSELLKIDPKLVHDRDFVKDLKIMTQNILDEIGFHFDEMDWINAESKEKLKNVHTIDDYLFGPSEKFLNQTMVDKALKFYQDYFRKMRPFADDNMKKLAVRPHCKPAYYETVFRVADEAFQLYNDYDFGHYGHNVLSYNFYQNNAANNGGNKKMIFGLQYIDGFRQKLPLPFVYGAIGETIGHETFHSYGIQKILIDGVNDVFNSYTYRSAVSCLEDYYSSFIGPNWTRPDGAMKANEGFADLQSARMIARLIKRGIYKEAHKDSSRWFSVTKDFDHFDEIIGRDDDDRDLKLAFSALTDLYCAEYFQEQNDTKLETKHMMEDVHARNSIRTNAIHRQLPEFTETFKCSHDSRMYRVEELCDAFPFYEKVKSGATWWDYEDEMK